MDIFNDEGSTPKQSGKDNLTSSLSKLKGKKLKHKSKHKGHSAPPPSMDPMGGMGGPPPDMGAMGAMGPSGPPADPGVLGSAVTPPEQGMLQQKAALAKLLMILQQHKGMAQ